LHSRRLQERIADETNRRKSRPDVFVEVRAATEAIHLRIAGGFFYVHPIDSDARRTQKAYVLSHCRILYLYFPDTSHHTFGLECLAYLLDCRLMVRAAFEVEDFAGELVVGRE